MPKFTRTLGALLASTALGLASGQAFAQSVPSAGTPASSDASTVQPTPTNHPAYIFLDQVPEAGHTPLSVSYSNFRRDTPAMRYDDCVSSYGDGACTRIAQSNADVCSWANDILTDLLAVDQTLNDSDDAERVLMDVYNQLPRDIQRNTRVRRVSEVIGTTSLCVLSFGLYCIAAVANGVNSEMAGTTFDHMSLASIRLGILNIVVTRANIRLNQLSIRANGLWMHLAVPACERGGYGHFVSAFAPLGAYNNPVPRFVVTGRMADNAKDRRESADQDRDHDRR